MTAYWFVQHDLKSYLEHKDKIGHPEKRPISGIKRGDYLVYYAIGDRVVVGTFKVLSDITHAKVKRWNSHEWYWVYTIKPVTLATSPQYLDIDEIKKQLDMFKKGRPWRFTREKISKKDFDTVTKAIKKPTKREKLFSGPAWEEGIGRLNPNLEIMAHEPTNEQGVVALFSKFMDKLPYGFTYFKFIRGKFPDACIYTKERDGKFREKYIEFEYRSSKFRDHIKNVKHKTRKCDYIVCWEHDYLTCPPEVEVIELKKELEKLSKQRSRG